MYEADESLILQVKAKIKGANEIHGMNGKIGLYRNYLFAANRFGMNENRAEGIDLSHRLLQIFVSTGEIVNLEEVRRRKAEVENL